MVKFYKNLDSIIQSHQIKSDIFIEKISHYINKFPDNDIDVINSMLGLNGKSDILMASDISGRSEASKTFSDIMIEHRAKAPPNRRYLFITICDEIGFSSDRTPIAPIKPLKEAAYQALNRAGLNALGVIEVHPLMNFPGKGQGRTLLYHCHLIGWTDKQLTAKEVKIALTGSRSWRNSLGATPIHVQAVGDRPEDLSAIAFYLFKAPFAAKNRRAVPDKPGKFKLLDTIKGYRPDLALRVLEGWSQISLMDLAFGVGREGSKVRQQLRASLKKWHDDRPPAPIFSKNFDAWLFWAKLRKDHGSQLYLPYRFDGHGGLPAKPPRRHTRKIVKKPKRHRRLRPWEKQVTLDQGLQEL
jgi:hypothetical protein